MTRIRFRVVLDTNVLISSQLSKSEDSPNKEIIQRWHDDQFDVLWTEDIFKEEQILRKKAGKPGVSLPRMSWSRRLFRQR